MELADFGFFPHNKARKPRQLRSLCIYRIFAEIVNELAVPGLAISSLTAAMFAEDWFVTACVARAGLADADELEVFTSEGSVGKLLVMVGKGGAKKIAEIVCPGAKGKFNVVFLISVGIPV